SDRYDHLRTVTRAVQLHLSGALRPRRSRRTWRLGVQWFPASSRVRRPVTVALGALCASVVCCPPPPAPPYATAYWLVISRPAPFTTSLNSSGFSSGSSRISTVKFTDFSSFR